MKHTPGPWLIKKNTQNPDSLNFIWRTNGDNANSGYARICRDVTDANARLIAAAPDLYEACKQLVEFRGRWLDRSEPQWLLDIIEAAKMAIQKAEGSTEGKTR